MRKGIILGIGMLVFAAILALILLPPRTPPAGPWKLADGSELSLAGVTYGKHHTMRYGNRIVDYLYPVLTPALRKKFGCKVATVTAPSTNLTVVWFWRKGLAPPYTPRPDFRVSVVDENGVESASIFVFNTTVLWQKTNLLTGVGLTQYPRRSREINVRIRGFSDFKVRGEARIENRTPTNYPVWRADPIPFTIKTNDLEISLVRFETGLSESKIKSGTVAEFRITRDRKPCDDWILRNFSARSATGEQYDRDYWRADQRGSGGMAIFRGGVSLWPEEPAWKLTAEFLRTDNYRPSELWVLEHLPIPAQGEGKDLNLTTNVFGSEIELIGIYRNKMPAKAKTDYAPVSLLVSSPIPAPDAGLFLVAVRDDRGRKVDYHLDHEVESTGGRGATLRQLDKDYFLYPEPDAATFTATLAYTKTITVEFMARPTLAKELL